MVAQPSLAFCAQWEKHPEATWSGTTIGLRKALASYFDIEDVSLIVPQRGESICRGIARRLGRYDFDLGLMRRQESDLMRHGGVGAADTVFQFSEVPFPATGRRSYIYQDLSVEWLLRCRNNDPELYSFTGFKGISGSAMEKRVQIQRRFYQDAAGIFTMGKWQADFLVKELGLPESKVHHVGGGINCPLPTKIPEKGSGAAFLFIGRDFKRKGGDLVVDAFRKLHEIDSSLRLVVAGPAQNPCQGVKGIDFRGDVNGCEVASLFANSDVFVMPSRFEAYGLVFPEAMAFGLPCIGRDAFEMREFIDDGANGKLVRSDDPDELADAMWTCLKDEEIKASSRANAGKASVCFSWDAVARRIASIIVSDSCN